jgi:D-galactarolactone isomerase
MKRAAQVSRREFVGSSIALASAALGVGGCAASSPAQPEALSGERLAVPVSGGTEPPSMAMPFGATDCHHHIFDPRFPRPNGRQGVWGTVADYRLLRRRLGLSRSVVVSPASYGFDNSCLVDALDQLGSTSRGVAAIQLDTTASELDRLRRHGVRGIRLYLIGETPTAPEQFELYARRIERLGWHIQVVANKGDALVAAEPAFRQLPCTLVIDHLGHINQPEGVRHPSMATLRRLIDGGRTYVKLSGPYISSRIGPPTYADIDPVATELVQAAPERVVWGTDWPHPTVTTEPKPDDAAILDRLAVWAAGEATRRRILVDNPTRLYWAT